MITLNDIDTKTKEGQIIITMLGCLMATQDYRIFDVDYILGEIDKIRAAIYKGGDFVA